MKKFFVRLCDKLRTSQLSEQDKKELRWNRIIVQGRAFRLGEIDVPIGTHVWIIPIMFEIEEKPELIEGIISGYKVTTSFMYSEDGKIEKTVRCYVQDKEQNEYMEGRDFDTMYAFDAKEWAQELLDAQWDAYILDDNYTT